MEEPLKDRLRKALDSHRLMQREFAELAGVSDSVVSNILLGRDPRYSTYQKVNRALSSLEGADAAAS